LAKQFVCTSTEPIVQTSAGKYRGFIVDGTYTFHGIKYADAERFQMPKAPKSFEGVKDAHSYGYVCPMLSPETATGEIMVPHRYWPKDENCQYLNIWSQSIDKEAKKPVMVWLHGGGFAAGSSIEQICYDGENLSRFGDVVVVTLNHRLNILGYLDLSPFGEKYKNSGNAGNADLVAALEWVRDNIAGFGGDPDNVTIFGQSGGGMKVWTLMQTPAADGLFHKGIIQSGVINGFVSNEKQDGTVIVKALLKELDIPEDEIEKLEKVPYEQLAAAYNKVSPDIAKTGAYIGGNPMVNDWYLGDPVACGFTDHAKTIPVLIGSVFGEFAFGPGVHHKYELSEDEILEMLRKKYKGSIEEFVEMFKKAYPDKNLSDALVIDSIFRAPTIDFIKAKVEHPESPTYSYLFAFEFPFDDGKPAWHCSDLPFVFHNTDKVVICGKPGVSDELEEKMAKAWVNFAKYGDPGCELLPEWTPCVPGDEATMIFDENCEVRHNFDHDLIKKHLEIAPSFWEMFRPKDDDEEMVILH